MTLRPDPSRVPGVTTVRELRPDAEAKAHLSHARLLYVAWGRAKTRSGRRRGFGTTPAMSRPSVGPGCGLGEYRTGEPGEGELFVAGDFHPTEVVPPHSGGLEVQPLGELRRRVELGAV